jgi:hypothetical protein
MSGYAKLFSEIVESSIWDEDSNTCKVWITLLALADSEGFIRGSPGWLAKRSRVDVDTVDKALTKFQSPDPFSRTPGKEGRRLETTPDGWVIINYAYYRDQDGKELSKDDRRSYQREWMRKKRAELKSSECQQVSTGVNTCQPSASASASVLFQGKEVQKEGEITFEQAMSRVPIHTSESIGPHTDFAKMVFESWDSVDGKNGAGVSCRFEKLLKKRWIEEGEAWANGCHPKQKNKPVALCPERTVTPEDYAKTQASIQKEIEKSKKRLSRLRLEEAARANHQQASSAT